ncbi:MAG TPA: VTT domain-containing protein [Candidatus Didemnitutus sp.]|jgi:uncharacterized membrane protein YdjX (TVP38/TMEM64 family)
MEATPKKNRALLIKLGLAAVVLLVAVGLVARGVDLRALVQQGVDAVQRAGPAAFFIGMALLPAVGAPITFFTLTAGSVFADRLGLGWVIVLALLALGVNIALTYTLAAWAFRPLLEKLVVRLGYRLPDVESTDATDLIVLLRVTPGIPFCVQNYLLGLARVPFGKYFLISFGIQGSMAIALILFGHALLQGRGKIAFIAISVVLALGAAAQLLRKHYGRRKGS